MDGEALKVKSCRPRPLKSALNTLNIWRTGKPVRARMRPRIGFSHLTACMHASRTSAELTRFLLPHAHDHQRIFRPLYSISLSFMHPRLSCADDDWQVSSGPSLNGSDLTHLVVTWLRDRTSLSHFRGLCTRRQASIASSHVRRLLWHCFLPHPCQSLLFVSSAKPQNQNFYGRAPP
jgi:hypothetical protein